MQSKNTNGQIRSAERGTNGTDPRYFGSISVAPAHRAETICGSYGHGQRRSTNCRDDPPAIKLPPLENTSSTRGWDVINTMATCRNAKLVMNVEPMQTGTLRLHHELRFQSGARLASQLKLSRHAQCPNSPVICYEVGYANSSWPLDDPREGDSDSHLRNHRHSVSQGLFLLYTDSSHHRCESKAAESGTGELYSATG
jgi:hypothetical protein